MRNIGVHGETSNANKMKQGGLLSARQSVPLDNFVIRRTGDRTTGRQSEGNKGWLQKKKKEKFAI